MPIPSPDKLYKAYDQEVQSAIALTSSVSGVKHLRRNKVFEGALLQCLTGWERVAEQCYIAYLCEATTRGGETVQSILADGPLMRRRRPPEQRAMDLLLGDSTRPYMDWLDPEYIKKRARLWFPDEPRFLNALQALQSDDRNHLKDMIAIRNHIAHRSAKSEKAFSELRKALYSDPMRRRGMGPGQLLSAKVGGGRTRLKYYASMLLSAADVMTA